ncbi:MAG: HIT domain-containing protein [Thermoanaerobaculaceae bacterium]
MQRLFAPWRFAYVSHAGASSDCVLCTAAGGGDETLTLARGERTFALLNRFPYTSGHAMVAPIAHVADFSRLEAATLTEMMGMVQRVVRAVQQVYQPHGFNIGFNLGEAAGAGIADHLHLHVVPRWRGDTNFMAVTAGVRVLPEDLSETLAKLRRALEVTVA